MTRIQANDIAIEYEERGAPGDPVIIMVRGLGTQLIDWPRSMLDLLIDEGFRAARSWRPANRRRTRYAGATASPGRGRA